MRSKAMTEFWENYARLPENVQKRANRAYRLWLKEPRAKGLAFKLVNPKGPLYSVRIGRGHRALGVLRGDTIYWYWIGKHDEYMRRI